VIHVTAHASVYTLVLMSLDRYLAVVHPITSMTIRNVRNTSVALAAAWFIIVVANAPMLSVFKVRITVTKLLELVSNRETLAALQTMLTSAGPARNSYLCIYSLGGAFSIISFRKTAIL